MTKITRIQLSDLNKIEQETFLFSGESLNFNEDFFLNLVLFFAIKLKYFHDRK